MSLPRPLAADATVVNDMMTRELVVRVARNASGTARLAWREGVQALAQAEAAPDLRTHLRANAPTVWARGAGRDNIARGMPGEDGSVRFRFDLGDSTYKRLVSTPGLRAVVVIDWHTRRLLSVSFRGR